MENTIQVNYGSHFDLSMNDENAEALARIFRKLNTKVIGFKKGFTITLTDHEVAVVDAIVSALPADNTIKLELDLGDKGKKLKQ